MRGRRCRPRRVAMCCVWPAIGSIAIHSAGRTIIPVSRSCVPTRTGGPIVRASGYHVVPAENAGLSAGRHRRPAMVHAGKLRTIGAGQMLMPNLVLGGSDMVLVLGP